MAKIHEGLLLLVIIVVSFFTSVFLPLPFSIISVIIFILTFGLGGIKLVLFVSHGEKERIVNTPLKPWNKKEDASKIWYLIGLTGINPIATIYVLSTACEDRLYSYAWYATFIGPISLYYAEKDKDHKLSDLSRKLMIGNIFSIILIIILEIAFPSIFHFASF